MTDREQRREDRRQQRKARKAAERTGAAAAPLSAPPVGARLDPAEWLGDIDAWNLRAEGGWLRFDARLTDEVRGYLRPLAGGDIIADAPGPLTAILGIGGPRAAGFNSGPPRFAFHILSPADHIGAVGTEGTAAAARTNGLQRIAHRPREALCADLLLSRRHAARRGLPLMLVRTETAAAATLDLLSGGPAFDNFLAALDNLCAAAGALGRAARVLAVTLTWGTEDLATPAPAFETAMRALMARIEAEMRVRGLAPPVFLAMAEAGTADLSDHPAIEAFHALSWRPGPHRLILPAPGYMFAQEGFGRPTEAGRQDMAAMDAHAIEAAEHGADWFCPTPLLAEAEGTRLRVIFRAMEDLVIDPADPLGAGPAAGFRISEPEAPAILSAGIDESDPRALILTCAHAPGPQSRLLHACGLPPQGDGRCANRSAVRDLWQAKGAGGPLARWALPAVLPIHPGDKG